MSNEPPVEGLFVGSDDPTEVDLASQISFQEEQFALFFPKVGVRKIDLKQTPMHELFREPLQQRSGFRMSPPEVSKVFKPTVWVHAYADYSPEQWLLIKYGMDLTFDVMFSFLLHQVDSLGCRPLVGDLIVFKGRSYGNVGPVLREYEVKNVTGPIEGYWQNSFHQMYWMATTEIHRPENYPRGGH